MNGGIYRIINKVNGKCYVGRAKSFSRRFAEYRRGYANAKPDGKISQYLYRSMLKYGFDAFEFTIVEECEYEDQPEREQYWITHYNSANTEFGYNLRQDVDNVMIVHPLTSQKISSRLKKEWESGIRDAHSDKLKASWERRSRDDQSKVMTDALTKWMYIVDNGEPVFYKDLVEMGLENVMSSFHKKKADSVMCKGHSVTRVRVESPR